MLLKHQNEVSYKSVLGSGKKFAGIISHHLLLCFIDSHKVIYLLKVNFHRSSFVFVTQNAAEMYL